MAEENLLRIDVEKRTTRGRVCPRCGGKIIPSDRAVYQSAGDPDAVFPLWQCERCGYEEMSAVAKTAARSKTEAGKAKGAIAAGSSMTPGASKALAAAPLDAQGRPYPPDVAQLLERLKLQARTDQ